MRTIPYPVALNGLQSKHVRDAFKRVRWDSSKTLAMHVRREDMSQETVDLYMQAKADLRSRTLADIEKPGTWWLICSMWNAKRMSAVRERYQPTAESYEDLRKLSDENEAALDVFVAWLVIHVLSEGSPLQRLRRVGGHFVVQETSEQAEARVRAEAREAASNVGARELIASARRDGARVVFDPRVLLGSVLVQKNEFVRIRCGEIVATVKRVLLDEAAPVLLNMSTLYGWIEAHPNENRPAQICLRWSRGNGRTGGLNLHHADVERNFRGQVLSISIPVIDDSSCTVIEIPRDIPSTLDNDIETAFKVRLLAWQQRLRDARKEES